MPMTANAPDLQRKGTVILSPHADDAALSIGGVLCKRSLEEPITLVTIFGRSNYLRKAAFQNDWEAVTATRKEEDSAFANALNIRLRYLDFPEAGLRLGSSFDKLFSKKGHTKAEIPSDLLSTVKQIIDHERPKFLVAPLGLGLHHDHLLVNHLSYELASSGTPIVVYYEDLPYAAGLSENEILEHLSPMDPSLAPVYVSIEHEFLSKLANLMLYQSQIGEFEINVVKHYAAHWEEDRLYERLWTSASLMPMKVET
jgi:LmbE family N-acetylglucosaminyl deacetylase